MFCWYAREKWGSLFSLVAYEDCLEVCFVGLGVGRIFVCCLVNCQMEFGQVGSKRCGEMLKSYQLGVAMQGDSFHRENRFSLCNTAVL